MFGSPYVFGGISMMLIEPMCVVWGRGGAGVEVEYSSQVER